MNTETSLRDCYFRIRDSFGKTDRGSVFVISGEKGYGKGDLVSILEREANESGFPVFHASAMPGKETVKYQIFNDLLNKIKGTLEFRDSTETISQFEDYLSKSGRQYLFLEHMDNISQASKDLFFYLCDQAIKFKCTIVATVRNRGEIPKDELQFLEELSADPRIQMISLSRPTLQDVEFVLESTEYRLPEEFIRDIYSMTDNISLIRYTLFYYEEIGLIGKDKMINDALYRFTPIPPTLEVFYQSVTDRLSDQERDIVDLLMLSGQPLNVEMLVKVLAIDEGKIRKTLEKLSKMGVVSYENDSVDFGSLQFFSHYSEVRNNAGFADLITKIGANGSLDLLPLMTRLNLYLKAGKIDEIGTLIVERKKELLRVISNPEAQLEFLDKVRPELREPKAKKLAEMMTCQCYYEMGHTDEARACYENGDFGDVDPFLPKITLARIYTFSGDSKKALDLTQEILNTPGIPQREEFTVKNVKSLAYQRDGDTEKALNLVDEIIAGTSSEDLEDQKSVALSLKGVIQVGQGDYESAMQSLQESFRITEKHGLKRASVRNQNSLAVLFDYMGEYDKAISMYNDVIQNSYVTSDLRVRTLAIYNIMEIYDLIGKYNVSENYVKMEKDLMRVVNDPHLDYMFKRYLSRHYFESFRMKESLEYASEALRIATEIGNQQWIEISRGMKAQLEGLEGESIDNDQIEILSKEFQTVEDFLPFYYLNSILFFLGTGREELKEKVIQNLQNLTKVTEDHYYKMYSLIGRLESNFQKGKYEEMKEIADESEKLSEGTVSPAIIALSYRYAMHAHFKEVDEATKTLERVRSLRPAIPPLYEYVSQLIIQTAAMVSLGYRGEQLDLSFLDIPDLPLVLRKFGEDTFAHAR